VPVQRAEDVLSDYVRDYLALRVPEDQMATYTVSPVTIEMPVQCEEHGETTAMVIVWQINIHIESLVDEEAQPHQLYGSLPFEFLCDGDTEPLQQMLDELWKEHVAQTSFAALTNEVDGELDEMVKDLGLND
jgi:hypothetical protein